MFLLQKTQLVRPQRVAGIGQLRLPGPKGLHHRWHARRHLSPRLFTRLVVVGQRFILRQPGGDPGADHLGDQAMLVRFDLGPERCPELLGQHRFDLRLHQRDPHVVHDHIHRIGRLARIDPNQLLTSLFRLVLQRLQQTIGKTILLQSFERSI